MHFSRWWRTLLNRANNDNRGYSSSSRSSRAVLQESLISNNERLLQMQSAFSINKNENSLFLVVSIKSMSHSFCSTTNEKSVLSPSPGSSSISNKVLRFRCPSSITFEKKTRIQTLWWIFLSTTSYPHTSNILVSIIFIEKTCSVWE